MSQTDELRDRLAERLPEYGIPAAALGVLQGDEIAVGATGTLNVETGVPATADAVFQLGSLGKVYTATLAMTLVEAGELDLDEPIRRWMPGFRVADPDATARTTARDLLTHTSGIAGDFFPDTGRGDDAVARYVELCANLGQDVPFHATWSYSNTGYVILGRLIEVITGMPWDAALRERVLSRLGLRRTVSLPEDALRHRAAYGHMGQHGGRPVLAPGWGPPRALGPAGWVIADARDVLSFARTHLMGGLAADGSRLLSAELAGQMQSVQVTVPDRWSTADAWGLGWWLHDWGGRKLIGHDGSAWGQNSYLKVVPDRELAIVLLTNGGRSDELARVLFAELLDELAGVAYLPMPEARADGAPDEALAGGYERHGVRLDVSVEDGTLLGSERLIEPLVSQLPPQDPSRNVLAPSTAGDNVYLSTPVDGGGPSWPLVFFDVGQDRYVHSGARAMRKVA